MTFVDSIRKADFQTLEAEIRTDLTVVNRANERGITPLIAAIASGRRDVVELLLKCGANPNYNTPDAPLPLIFATDTALDEEDYDRSFQEVPTDVLALLVSYGANIHQVDVTEAVSPYEYAKGRSFLIEDFFNKVNQQGASG